MIPIYICEDEENIREHIVDVINKYIIIQDYDMEVELASADPEEVLEARSIKTMRSIYFFDVDLKHDRLNGFDLAKRIRELDPRGFIIFITTHGEMSFETFRYRVEAMDYIVKDDITQVTKRIQACMDEVQNRIHQDLSDQEEYYSVKIFGRIHNIRMDDILYFETSPLKHRIILHAMDEELEYFGKLSDIEEQLEGSFIRSHRSYLLNRKNIKTIYFADDKVELINGEVCPLSRGAKKKLKDVM